MHRTHIDAEFRKTGLHFGQVIVIGKRHGRIRHESDLPDTAEEIGDLPLGVLEISLAGIGRIADQQQAHRWFSLHIAYV